MSNASAPRKAAGFGVKEPLARMALAAFAVLACAIVSASAQETISDKEVIDVANLDEALDWAAKIPNAHFGTIEVRPVMEFDG